MNNGEKGILIEGGTDQCMLSGNICSSNDEGITIDDNTSDRNAVVGNICLSNTSANYTDNGTIATILGNGGSETIQYEGDPIRAFGMANITLYIRCAEASEDTRSASGFILGPFVLVGN